MSKQSNNRYVFVCITDKQFPARGDWLGWTVFLLGWCTVFAGVLRIAFMLLGG